MRINYFAFGSNMSRRRIETRLGACELVGSGFLPRYELRFHKRGNDGSGKCDIVPSAGPSGGVHGVLYGIDRPQREQLDAIEGPGYECVDLRVHAGGEIVVAYAYIALARAISPALKPYHWYKELVVCGAREHGLPKDYVRRIAGVAAEQDPDEQRAHQNLALLHCDADS